MNVIKIFGSTNPNILFNYISDGILKSYQSTKNITLPQEILNLPCYSILDALHPHNKFLRQGLDGCLHLIDKKVQI